MIPGLWSSGSAAHLWIGAPLVVLALLLVSFLGYTAWVLYRFLPTITRVFEETPIFVPPSEPPDPDAEQVRFQAAHGVWLQGSWLRSRAGTAMRTIVFCHEFLSDRWSCRPYCEPLRAAGFDVFTFDFRNHGQSESLTSYRPMQWASNYELLDLRAALAHVRSRATGGEPWVGLVGVSRGGSAAILAAAVEPCVRAVATDGAFPTHSTQLAYMRRWAGIFAGEYLVYRLTPDWYFSMLSGIARGLGARRHGCRFLKVEAAIAKLSPRPLLMIHGERDSYIAPEIAQGLFSLAGEPKHFWLVADARHNAAVEVATEQYAERLLRFFSEEV